MNIETLREFCLQKPFVTEGFPFGEDTLVFKVKARPPARAGTDGDDPVGREKIFLLAGLDSSPLQFNIKCDPGKAIELREEFPESVLPGYHMNKKHWNTVIVDGRLSVKQLTEMIDHSYALVLKKK
ncbi:MAG: MmcQ/YjbR family DNA-binding protein [Ferruginibacter sp.]